MTAGVRKAVHSAWMAGFLLLAACASTSGRYQDQIEFGIESAQKGLWNEAVFRWQRSLEQNPQNPILHNNLAVAYESLGRFDEAAASYERALELAQNRYEAIRDNYERFMAFYTLYRNQLDDAPEGS